LHHPRYPIVEPTLIVVTEHCGLLVPAAVPIDPTTFCFFTGTSASWAATPYSIESFFRWGIAANRSAVDRNSVRKNFRSAAPGLSGDGGNGDGAIFSCFGGGGSIREAADRAGPVVAYARLLNSMRIFACKCAPNSVPVRGPPWTKFEAGIVLELAFAENAGLTFWPDAIGVANTSGVFTTGGRGTAPGTGGLGWTAGFDF